MSLDFSAYLLNYTQRFYVKQFDMVTLSISLTALFVVMVSAIVNISSGIQNEKIISSIFELVILVLLLITLYLLQNRQKKTNHPILRIEKIIVQNYDSINGRNNVEKDCILEEFQQVFTNKKDPERLIELLSKSDKE